MTSASVRAALYRHRVQPALVTGLGLSTQSLLPLFSGVSVGGYWDASTPSNTSTTWLDSSGLGNNLTRSGTTSDQWELGSDVLGRPVYRNATTGANVVNYALPAISINRRSHSIFAFYRTRSHAFGADRGIASFGAGFSDCLYSDSGASRYRVIGTGTQNSTIKCRSDHVCYIANADASNVTLRVNGVSQALSAFTTGSVTGGRLFSRTDGFALQAEVYAFGLLDRTLTNDEMTLIENVHKAMFGAWPTYGQVLIEGDALTEGYGMTPTQSWTKLLDDDIGAQFIQRSVAFGGRALSGEISSVSTKAGFYDAGLTKNVAVMCLGTNDLGASRTSTQVLTDMQTWCTTMKSAGWQTIVCTIADRDDTGWSGAKETERLAVNTGIASLTSLDAVCDVAGLSVLSDPTNTTYFDADKLHWKAAAQSAVKDAVKAAVESV